MKCLFVLSAVLILVQGSDAGADDKPVVGRMVYYSGKVQGVGFRNKTANIAQDYPVSGWVKNLDDGRVQLLVEGKEEAVLAFLKAVRTHWEKNITKEEIKEQAPTGKYIRFDVVW